MWKIVDRSAISPPRHHTLHLGHRMNMGLCTGRVECRVHTHILSPSQLYINCMSYNAAASGQGDQAHETWVWRLPRCWKINQSFNRWQVKCRTLNYNNVHRLVVCRNASLSRPVRNESRPRVQRYLNEKHFELSKDIFKTFPKVKKWKITIKESNVRPEIIKMSRVRIRVSSASHQNAAHQPHHTEEITGENDKMYWQVFWICQKSDFDSNLWASSESILIHWQ